MMWIRGMSFGMLIAAGASLSGPAPWWVFAGVAVIWGSSEITYWSFEGMRRLAKQGGEG